MTMHVAEQHHLIIFVVHGDQLFGEVYRRVQQPTRIRPPSVQIRPYKIAAVVPSNHSIRIEHRHNLEDESLSQQLCLLVILLKQKLDGTVYQKLGRALSRMHSGGQEDDLFGLPARGFLPCRLLLLLLCSLFCIWIRIIRCCSGRAFCRTCALLVILSSRGLGRAIILVFLVEVTASLSTLFSTQLNVVLLDIVCDGQDVARVASHRLAQLLDFQHVVEVLDWIARP